jgi:hypothetical protein
MPLGVPAVSLSHRVAAMEEMPMLAIRCLRLAGVYWIAGIVLGLVMGATQAFALAPVHAHMNLLGWVSLAIAALVFTIWPKTGTTRLARAFFWIYNLSLPVMLLALALLLLGRTGFTVVTIIGSVGVFIGAILFVVNLFIAIPAAASGASGASQTRD